MCRQTQWRGTQAQHLRAVLQAVSVIPLEFAQSAVQGAPDVPTTVSVSHLLRTELGPPLMVQWLRLWASNLGSIPSQGIKIPRATWYGQKKRKRKKNPPWEDPTVERILVFCAYGWEKLLGLAIESRGPPGPPGGWQVLIQGGMGKRTDTRGYNPWS